MNTFRRSTLPLALVGVVATGVLSAGAASAKAPPIQPNLGPAAVVTVHAHPATHPHRRNAAEDRTRLLLEQSYIQRGEAELAEEAAADVRSRAAREHPGVGLGKLDTTASTGHQGATSNQQSSGSGAVAIPWLVVTAVAGLALGAAGSTASRRLRDRAGLAT